MAKSIAINAAPSYDSLKFQQIYVDALKNKMLKRTELAKKQFKECLKINPKSTASAYQLATILFEEKDFDKSKKLIEFCLKIKPEKEWFLLLRAQIARTVEDKKTYKKIYEKLVATYPNNLAYNYELAVICYKYGEYNKALTLLNEIQAQLGVNETVSFLKNNVYYKLKQYRFIGIELKTLQKTFPDSTKYSDMLADFYLKSNNSEDAISLYKKNLEQDSSNANSKVALAWLYAKQKQFAMGYPHLIDVLSVNIQNFDRMWKLSNLYLESDQLDGEKYDNIYELLAESKDLNSEFLEKYIAYLYYKKDLMNAEKYSLLSIKKFPDNYQSWNYYFEILIKLNRYEALNKYAKQCLEYFPNQASVYFYCGYSHFSLKQYEKAIGFLQTSVDYSMDNKELRLQNYLIIAESYHSLGKHKNSDKYFDKYLKEDSSNANLLNNYAYYMLQRGINYDKALQLSRKSLEIEPFNSSFLDTYAWILFAKGKYRMALNYIERAHKYGGNKSASILDHYGDINSKLGKKDEAKIMWKEAYRISKSKTILDKINK